MKSLLIWAFLLGITIPASAGTSKNESIETLNKSRELQQTSKEVFDTYVYPDGLPHVPINKMISAKFPDNVKLAIQNQLILEGYQYCLFKQKGVDIDLTAEAVMSHGFGLVELLAYDEQASWYFDSFLLSDNRTEESELAPFYIYSAMDADCQISANDVREIFIKLEGKQFDLNSSFWKQYDESLEKEQEK